MEEEVGAYSGSFPCIGASPHEDALDLPLKTQMGLSTQCRGKCAEGSRSSLAPLLFNLPREENKIRLVLLESERLGWCPREAMLIATAEAQQRSLKIRLRHKIRGTGTLVPQIFHK